MSSMMAVGDTKPRPARRWRLALTYIVCLWIALSLRVRSFDAVRSPVLSVSLRRPILGSEAAAIQVLAEIDHVSRWVPVRFACLERSLTAVALVARRGWCIGWSYGIASYPMRAHAWVHHNGVPIGEDIDVSAYAVVQKREDSDRGN
ncbi:lasso peptide biosynthesis B2 protein [Haloglycomyces albus]|uniref:lasso peptide biosynthesis B2 protein n=1 Tax=Haloglycomyces albus TaxID=526067 RepID=UPI0004BBC866|nr:lasso peptide biosynthesis B2 protein [Haloglycomyces albus]